MRKRIDPPGMERLDQITLKCLMKMELIWNKRLQVENTSQPA